MSEVFVSYAREDKAKAEQLVAALQARGWDVWWDPELLAGSSFAEVIEGQLRSAQAVIVLWSRSSVESGFVQDEAGMARDRDVLAPVRLDGAEIPLGFRSLHTPDLTAWNGRADDPVLRPLLDAVSRLLGRPALPLPPPVVTAPPPPAGAGRADPGPPGAAAGPPPVTVTPPGRDDEPAGERRSFGTPAYVGIGLVAVAVLALGAVGGRALLSGSDDGNASVDTTAGTAPATTDPTTCRPIQEREECRTEIQELENLLDRAGFRISVNSTFGRHTKQALTAFQHTQGFEEDALIDYGTGPEWARLVALASNPMRTITLPYGGPEDVEIVQGWLFDLGYYQPGAERDREVDGLFGDNTAAALRAWEEREGRDVDGRIEVDGEEWKALGEDARAVTAPSTSTTIVGSTAEVTTTVVATSAAP